MTFKGSDYCMRNKCKTCERNLECMLLNNTLKERLTYKPFEEILKDWGKKND